ncbi:Potassium channel tetramerization-type BTB domain [Penicillium digitatum]|uniref:Potassium channel tetramerization-type BTB domain n=1 Tax=Penicillium digitatum TaxID=36651 RepID=A0A7T6XM27_PENDI|nr:Potassium channel tetramerization-type BTB domain [Penicillium digitatum]
MPDDEGTGQNSPPTQARQITLQVGERRFVTTLQTLVPESNFFASLLSGRWDDARADGSYFLDADPTLFEHILRYLRRRVLPIFYDIGKGHDHALYLALLEEAKYFQIARLQDWLENKQYLHALSVECSIEEDEGTPCRTTLSTDTSVKYYPGWGTKKVQCLKARGDADAVYDEEPVSRWLVVKKRTVFDMQACVAGRFEIDIESKLFSDIEEGSHWCPELGGWYDTDEEVEQNNINENGIRLIEENSS